MVTKIDVATHAPHIEKLSICTHCIVAAATIDFKHGNINREPGRPAIRPLYAVDGS